ncbi:isoaspartyl peptidase/L-asparaginase [Candidatus Roseilinea sp. NK_OTU-006]|jgi:beta-aspartyl-peptidase (threonine type)|uniref:isoaspartyl peptidase/L-asparaginase n=1 Tax=Candidatus Roseilinea sp. NK_OTU-006 TaxID=2704250 RepID=UPI00145F965C|nr:isoaspartyl peptidase/L-asparaginase [Candidatus Roseilinea sp. NK_OTU-006]
MVSAPIILANAEIRDEFIADGMRQLRRGASAGDVAELVACAVEDDPEEHTVGYGGWPNILGEVELDASFMDGATLRAGAVAALKGFRHPISVARQVMLRLPHVLLVGEGAARFATEIGAERRDMLSPEAQAAWRQRIAEVAQHEEKDAITLTMRALVERRGSDTMNVIVRDAAGNMCSAVSTSGIAWKYPGRVGDSPIIGAGNYCDNRYGAAACMGLGEVAIRIGAAAQAVMLMRLGWSLEAAGREVACQLYALLGESNATDPMRRADWVRILIMDAAGNVGAFATRPGLSYKVQTADDPRPITREAVCPV